ncbi:putative Nuclear localization sequence-binding protein [Blattamonas nauphoetae]|uniref:Nuclear localization sequence-binding protein n=1 Tax=Blattamonas nauphoetae TaxID=2049346 RepID=A0ABQ9X958_9EUKA|nr:putative Nuclear localization sequence-binding protein [Blattamonas nauphoetae]
MEKRFTGSQRGRDPKEKKLRAKPNKKPSQSRERKDKTPIQKQKRTKSSKHKPLDDDSSDASIALSDIEISDPDPDIPLELQKAVKKHSLQQKQKRSEKVILPKKRPSKSKKPQKTKKTDQQQGATVVIRNLPFSANSDSLMKLFMEFHPVSVQIASLSGSDRSKGFAFVLFSKKKDAQFVVSEFNGSTIGGRTVTVEISNKTPEELRQAELQSEKKRSSIRSDIAPSTTLFITNLPFDATEDDLTNHFRKFNPSSVRIAYSMETGKSRGIAFVECNSVEEATQVKEEMHQSKMNGRSLGVNFAEPKKSRPSEHFRDFSHQEEEEEEEPPAFAGYKPRSDKAPQKLVFED